MKPSQQDTGASNEDAGRKGEPTGKATTDDDSSLRHCLGKGEEVGGERECKCGARSLYFILLVTG